MTRLYNIHKRIDKNDEACDDIEFVIKIISSQELGGMAFDSDESDSDSESMGQDLDNEMLNVRTQGEERKRPNENAKLIQLGSDGKFGLKRRNTIAAGLIGDNLSQRQKLRAWYDQYSVNNTKANKRGLFNTAKNYDAEAKANKKLENKFGHGIA